MTWILNRPVVRGEPVEYERALKLAQDGARAKADAINLRTVLDNVETLLEAGTPADAILRIIRATKDFGVIP